MKLKLAHKLALGFGLVTALSVLIGWYSLDRLESVSRTSAQISEHDFEVVAMIRAATEGEDEMQILRERTVTQRLIEAGGYGQAKLVGLQEEWRRAERETGQLLERLRDKAAENEAQGISDERTRLWRTAREATKRTLELLGELAAEVESEFAVQRDADVAALLSRKSELAALRKRFNASLDQIERTVDELVRLGQAVAEAAYQQARLSVLIALGVVLALGIGASTIIQRGVTGPLREFMGLVEAVGAGDLQVRASESGGDEIAELGRSLNRMLEGLRGIASGTREATESLSAASAEIAASTRQQAASTTEQAASVQETTATMEELSQSGRQVSERVQRVSGLVEASADTSDEGLQAVRESARSMEGIREQAEVVAESIVVLSEKAQAIGEIIALVTDVAEQSNLIALNAAIEASAAGEHGRRFAVVANEVKSLAEQSKSATGQVRGLLQDIQKGINTLVMLTEEAVKRVESGRTQTSKAEEVIRQMTSSIEESASAFDQILGAAGQQQIGFEQVTEALKNIRDATEQTAAGTGQLEKAALGLDVLSTQLRASVQRYRV